MSIGTRELENSVFTTRDPIPVLVHRPVVPTAQEYEVGQRGRSSMSPVLDVMPLDEPEAARGEGAPLIAVQ